MLILYEQDVINPETGDLESRYRPGDSVLAVLKDLKKLWRKDDTDDERTVFRCFAEYGLCSELIALLEECTGRGEYGRKIALAAADLLAALTWPIDVQQELRDMLDDGDAATSDYATLLRKQVEFKVGREIWVEDKISLIIRVIHVGVDAEIGADVP